MSEPAGPAPDGRPDATHPPGAEDVRAQVDAMLAQYRAELLGGRGPGADRAELDRNTTRRPAVGGQPTAVTRELVHVRTQARRGADPGQIRRELAWARAWVAPAEQATDDHRQSTGERLLRAGALLAVAAAVAHRLRR
jgi:hypothetical protein